MKLYILLLFFRLIKTEAKKLVASSQQRIHTTSPQKITKAKKLGLVEKRGKMAKKSAPASTFLKHIIFLLLAYTTLSNSSQHTKNQNQPNVKAVKNKHYYQKNDSDAPSPFNIKYQKNLLTGQNIVQLSTSNMPIHQLSHIFKQF